MNEEDEFQCWNDETIMVKLFKQEETISQHKLNLTISNLYVIYPLYNKEKWNTLGLIQIP